LPTSSAFQESITNTQTGASTAKRPWSDCHQCTHDSCKTQRTLLGPSTLNPPMTLLQCITLVSHTTTAQQGDPGKAHNIETQVYLASSQWAKFGP